MTYARYLYQIYHWRTYGSYIPEGYEVDHINNDQLDDRLDNYQLLTSEENRQKQGAFRGRTRLVLACPVCGGLFSIPVWETATTKSGYGTLKCCTPTCANDLHFSTIPDHIRQWLLDDQTIYVIKEHDAWRNQQDAYCKIVEFGQRSAIGRTLHDLFSIPDLNTAGLIVCDYQTRKRQIQEGLANRQSLREIGREIGIHHKHVSKYLKRMLNEEGSDISIDHLRKMKL